MTRRSSIARCSSPEQLVASAFPSRGPWLENKRSTGSHVAATPRDHERLKRAGIEPIVGDIADIDELPLPRDLTHVFHAAARIGKEADSDWRKTFEMNSEVTGRLIAAARGARGFVFCSSGSTYAYQGRRPLREDDPPGVHLGVYSLSKIAAESVARFSAIEHGVPLTIIRIFSTYGPLGGAPADRLERIREGKEIVLHPDSPNNYNPIYEDDYVELGIRAMRGRRHTAPHRQLGGQRNCERRGLLHLSRRADRQRSRSSATTIGRHGQSGPTSL